MSTTLRRILTAGAGTLGGALVPLLAHAEITTYADLIRIIERVQAWLFWLLMSLAVIFILVAGYLFLQAGSSPENLKKAKNQVIYAIVAVAVAVLAKATVDIVRITLQ
ncbi:MAG: hypothetical protein AAB601_01110 [Patescibacteria group bacterium]